MCIHRPAYIGQLYAYTYFEPMYTCTDKHTQKNPNPKNKNKNQKNNKSNNLACFKTYNKLKP